MNARYMHVLAIFVSVRFVDCSHHRVPLVLGIDQEHPHDLDGDAGGR